MEMSGIVPAVLTGMTIAAILLPGMWRMLANRQKRNDEAHRNLRDAITRTATQLADRNDEAHRDLRDAITSTRTRLESRFDQLEVDLPRGFGRD